MKNIKSTAAPNEQSSPFYKKNKSLCETWESYIISKGGKVNGLYSASALALKASKNQWHIELEKSTMTNPSLILSAFTSNVISNTLLEIEEVDYFGASFTIRRSKKLDWIKPNTQKLDKNYTLKSRNPSATISNSFIMLIGEIDPILKLEKITFDKKKRKLRFQFRTIVTDFEMIEKLIKYSK